MLGFELAKIAELKCVLKQCPYKSYFRIDGSIACRFSKDLMFGTGKINGSGFEAISPRKPKPAPTEKTYTPHFLGAAVLEPQKRAGLIGVETLNIIDGQQRLTTLQYFLAGLAIILRSEGQSKLLSIVEACLLNSNTETMQNPATEIFKVWPTFRDRDNFQTAMSATSLDELRACFPQSFTQAENLKIIGVDHPPSLEAIWYFATQIDEWISAEKIEEKAIRLTESVFPGRLDPSRTKAILIEIETAMRSVRSEEPVPGGMENLDVDHILPVSWFEFWELPDKSFAQENEANETGLAALFGNALSDRQILIRDREVLKGTMGNLTLAHYGVNRSSQHREFAVKREKFFAESNLHLNRALMRMEGWTKNDIKARGEKIFEVASKIWNGPSK